MFALSDPGEPAARRTGRLAGLLVAAASAELLMLRIATRTVIHIPGIERAALPYRLLSETGRMAYYLAVVILVGLLVTMLLRKYGSWRWRWGRWWPVPSPGNGSSFDTDVPLELFSVDRVPLRVPTQSVLA